MNQAELFLIGATHRTAPLGLRERLALAAETEAAFACDLGAMAGLREFAVLNTCNRVEIYGVASGPQVVAQVEAAFCARQQFALCEFKTLRLDLRGPEVVQHLLEVAAGLDSQMLGENEIFGQVKQAYALAQARGSTGPLLNRVFQKAFQAAKHVRTNTAITSGLVSVANVAVDLALKIFGNLAETRILLLGAGDIGAKSARAFQSRGAASLAIASRRFDRAAAVAAELGAQAVAFEDSVARLGDFDVVVCSTAAPGTVISPEMAVAAMARRQGRPLFFIDVALPRDVHAAVAEIANVFLYNLDDLARIAAENRSAREAEIIKCRALLTARAETLWGQVERLLAPAARNERTETGTCEPGHRFPLGAGASLTV